MSQCCQKQACGKYVFANSAAGGRCGSVHFLPRVCCINSLRTSGLLLLQQLVTVVGIFIHQPYHYREITSDFCCSVDRKRSAEKANMSSRRLICG